MEATAMGEVCEGWPGGPRNACLALVRLGYDVPINWTDGWNQMLLTNDFVNAETRIYDPRHMHICTLLSG